MVLKRETTIGQNHIEQLIAYKLVWKDEVYVNMYGAARILVFSY